MENLQGINRTLSAAVLTVVLAACGGGSDEENGNELVDNVIATPSPTITSQPTPTGEPLPAPTIEPSPEVSPIPTPTQLPGARADNPFRGAQFYVDPVWSAKAAAEPGGDAIADTNTAVWLNSIADINAGIGLRGHLDEALTQGADMFMLVVNNLPNRDCSALVSNGELRIADNGFRRYQDEYIAPIAAIISDPLYADLRIVAIIEVDSLPNLVTDLTIPDCAEADGPGGYRDGIRHALDTLATLPNVYAYLDIANSTWLGWPDNFASGVDLIGDVVESTARGWDSIAGFVTNSAKYAPTVEPYLSDPNLLIDSSPIVSASFYDGAVYFDEKSFAQQWRQAMLARGAPETIGMLIDTSRNGWGGQNRPSQQSLSIDVDTFVDESRVDRRLHRENRCNQPGGIGFKPWADPYDGIDAFVWVKAPGESDGFSDPNAALNSTEQHNPMCNPSAIRPDGASSTGALDDAPPAGDWFPAGFAVLLDNAYPDANAPAGPPPTPVPSPQASPSPAPSPTPLASPTPVVSPTPVATPSPVVVPTPVATPTPVVVPTPAVTPTPVVVPTPEPTPTPVVVPTPAVTPTPVATPTPVYNVPLARDGWILSASSNEDELDLAVDGDQDTRWTTRQTQSNGDWLEIDFGESITFNRIILDNEESPNDFPVSFGVFISDDGVNWGSAIASGEGSDAITLIDINDVNSRFLLIEQYGSSNRFWWSIHELNVMLSDDSTPIPMPTPTPTPTVEPSPTPILTPTPEPGDYPEDPFGDNPESVVVESDIGWVEGPTWVPDEGGFIYNLTDRNSPDIHRIWRPDQDGTSEYFRVSGSNHGAIWSQGLIFMTNREPGRIGYIDPSQDPLEETVLRDGLGRPNDLDRFSDGSIYFSDWPRGNDGVYRLYMNGDMEQIISVSEIENPNGIAFTADCRRLYIANTGDSVVAYDVDDDGNLSNRRIHADNTGSVNGIAVDIAGNLYVPNGNGVRVYNSDGDEVGNWSGSQGVVNMTFGGDDHQWLLTTNKTGVTAVRTRIPGAECNGLGTQRPAQ